MSEFEDTERSPAQSLIQQLYENESLTDALTDEAARVLLDWGKRQLKNVAAYDVKQNDLERTARQLRRVMRSVNRSIELKAELTDDQMVQRLLTLVERAMQLALEKSTIQTETQD